MKRTCYTAVIFLLGMLLFFTKTEAQNQEKKRKDSLYFSVEMHGIVNQNFIDQVGSLMKYNTAIILRHDSFVLNYNFREKPLLMERGVKPAFRIRLEKVIPRDEQLLGSTIYGLSLASVNGGGNLKGVVESTPDELRWVRFWDVNIFPLVNTKEESGVSPIVYRANEEFNAWVGDLYAGKEIYFDGYRISFTSSLRTVRGSYFLFVGENQNVYIDERVNENIFVIFSNNVTLYNESKSNFFIMGPGFGVTFEKFIGKLAFQAKFSKNWLRMFSNQKGNFIDVDNIVISIEDTLGNHKEKARTIYNGEAKFNRQLNDWVSTSEFNLSATFKQGPVSFGVGTELSFWNGVPLVPTLHNPWGLGSATSPSGLGWQIRKRDLFFQSVFAYLRISIG